MKQNRFLKEIYFLTIAGTLLFLTSCTTTKHTLKRTTDNVKAYKKSEVLSLYRLKDYQIKELDDDMLMGFSFTEELKERQKDYRPVAIPPTDRPLYASDIDVNIDLCRHWKKTSYRERPLEERAYGKVYSTFNPTKYRLFMSLKKLKRKKLMPQNPSEQEDICIYVDSKYYGHFGRFRSKSNKIRYKASEINAVRLALEKK